MAYRKIETREQKFNGFFEYEPGNVIEGQVTDTVITGKTDNGKEKGYVGVKLIRPCLAGKDDVKFTAEVGQVIALSITSATRVLIGTEGKQVRCTFNGFKSTEKGKYHDWTVEIDDGQS
jgi:hypothetical protein